jgi:predicted TIM-barrel fold metal-dependent hydrolase
MVIDIHTHIYTRPYIEALSRRSEIPRVDVKDDGEHFVIFQNETELLGGTQAMTPAFYNVGEKLSFMRTSGIDRSVLSFGNPWLDFFEPGEAADWARSVNMEMAELAADHDELDCLGVLPLQNPAAAAAEVRHVAEDQHLKGVIMGTRAGQQHLDSPAVEPVWTALENADLPVMVHPHYCLGYEWMTGYGHALPLALAFPFETSAAAMRVVLSGLLDRHPRLGIILAHAGGTLPYLAGRLEKCVSVDSVSHQLIERSVHDYLRMFYYDAVTYDEHALRCTRALAGAGRIMFGTDHPFGIADPVQGLAAIDAACDSDEERDAMRFRTALELFGGLRPRAER